MPIQSTLGLSKTAVTNGGDPALPPSISPKEKAPRAEAPPASGPDLHSTSMDDRRKKVANFKGWVTPLGEPWTTPSPGVGHGMPEDEAGWTGPQRPGSARV